MTYNFNGDYINVAEIKYTHSSASDNPEYPYRLTVYFKDDSLVGVIYKTKKPRDDEAARIAARMDACFEVAYPQPLSAYQVKLIASSEVDKVRRDIRTLKKMIVEMED